MGIKWEVITADGVKHLFATLNEAVNYKKYEGGRLIIPHNEEDHTARPETVEK